MFRRRAAACILFLFCLCILTACSDGDGDPVDPGGGGGGGDTYDPPDATESRATGSLNVARNQHSATLLQDGRVLVTGGFDGQQLLASCEIYDPDTETWSLTAPLAEARVGHSATLLQDGRVLVAAGSGDEFATLRSWQLFDPATETWTALEPFEHPYEETTSLRYPRKFHAASLLPNGNVLITGGFSSYRTSHVGGDYEPTYDLFYTAIEQTDWRDPPIPLMLDRRYCHGSTLLADGRVLLTGGFNYEDDYLTACEIYDTAADTCAAAAPMTTPRMWHGAFLLDDGRVFVCGGKDDLNTFTRNCEIWDPVADAWTPTPTMRQPRARPCFVRFSDGRVLAAGNRFAKDTEICTPGGEWTLHHDLMTERYLFTMTVFANDVALAAGGLDIGAGDEYLSSCELYVP